MAGGAGPNQYTHVQGGLGKQHCVRDYLPDKASSFLKHCAHNTRRNGRCSGLDKESSQYHIVAACILEVQRGCSLRVAGCSVYLGLSLEALTKTEKCVRCCLPVLQCCLVCPGHEAPATRWWRRPTSLLSLIATLCWA